MSTPRYLLPLLLFLSFCVVPAAAEDTLRYFNINQQQFLAYPLLGRTMIQRFRTETPVRVLGFTMYINGSETGNVAVLLLEDAGGAGLPQFLDRQIADNSARPVTFTIQQPNQTLPATYRYPAEQQLVLREPGQFFIAVLSNANIRLLYDTTDNTAAMCGDNNPATLTSHELSSFVSVVQNGTRQFGALQTQNGSGNRVVNGSFLIEVYVEPIDTVAARSFADITSESFPADAGNGKIAWGDYDNDGDQDLLNSGALWTNDGTGRFARNTTLSAPDEVAIFVDLNNDGWLDILSASGALANNGNGTFTLRSGTGLQERPNATTITAADYDGDGLIDFFVGAGERPARAYDPAAEDSVDVVGLGYKSMLYRNLGDFTFQETSEGALGGYRQTPRGYNPATGMVDIEGWPVLGSSNWVDYDSDGHLDLFWGVDRFAANYLWRNNGDGTFTDMAEQLDLRGHAKAGAPGVFGQVIGSDWADYDNDGDQDLALGQNAVATLYSLADRTAIYRNEGNGEFEDVNNLDTMAARAGIAYNETHADVAWGDYDNDGLLDLYVNAAADCYHSSLYRQKGNGAFEPRTYQTGTGTEGVRGLAWVDIDTDGDLDLHVGGVAGRGRLFRNLTAATGNNWAAIGLRLAAGGNRFGIGSRITVFSGGRKLARTITAGYGSQSQVPPLAWFGLGAGAIDSVHVSVPGGAGGDARVVTYTDISAGRYTILTELSGSAAVPAAPVMVEGALGISPNPALFSARLSLGDAAFGAAPLIEIIDLLGQTALTLEGASFAGGGYQLDLAGLPAGTYMVRLSGNGRMALAPLTIVR